MGNYIKNVVRVFFALIFPTILMAQQHPSLLITKDNLPALREGIHQYPLLDDSFQAILKQVKAQLGEEIEVPTPKDAGGGYTHELHKKNYQLILNSAICYQLTLESQYLALCKELLFAYADQYRQWPEHPKRKVNHPSGRIFWQNLNDCVWLVHVAQAYDLIIPALSAAERRRIKSNLFEPMVLNLMQDHKDVFDKIHNHGTWSVAAVGITGLVLNKKEWLDKSLYGSQLDKETGFLKQLDELFSPDGYYAEGPYYQRYALSPFVLFAKAINNYRPELNIFNYRNGLLGKAIETVFQTSYSNGLLFPLNDAIKDKSIQSNELVLADNIAYSDIAADPALLGIAQQQKKVTLSDAGLLVAKEIFERKSVAFDYKTMLIRDGKEGRNGGIAIIRNGNPEKQQTLVIKNTTHGMGHGHFDRMNFLLYDNGGEVFSDYGAARFLNIESKSGGHYLKENNSWAKQTIAHNTMVLNEQSQFMGKMAAAEEMKPSSISLKNQDSIKYSIVSDNSAYPYAQLSRMLLTIDIEEHDTPLILDINYAKGKQSLKTIDLPYYYKGHVVDQSVSNSGGIAGRQTFGDKNGYQFLWLNHRNQLRGDNDFITVLNNYKFYKIHMSSGGSAMTLNHVSLGANDPEMNLLPTQGIILRQENADRAIFAQLIESYGEIDPIDETISKALSVVKDFNVVPVDESVFRIDFNIRSRTYQVLVQLKDEVISNIQIL